MTKTRSHIVPAVGARSPEVPLPAGRRRLSHLQELSLVFVTFGIASILAIYGWQDASPGRPNTFLNPANLIDGIATPMSYYAIMAVGMTFVVIAGGIDISVASIFALAGLVAAWSLQQLPPETPFFVVSLVSVFVPLTVGLVCGLINGAFVVGLQMHPFIVTLGTLSIFRGIANVLPFGAKTLPRAGQPLPEGSVTHLLRQEIAGIEAWPLITMILVVGFGWCYLQQTVWGRETYAVGGNTEAARFSGIHVNRVQMRVYALSGVLAGLAGLVSLGRFGTISTNSGSGYELTVVAAAVVGGASLVGGRGTALGALLGTLILALIENGINIMRLNQEYKNVIIGVAIILAVAADRLGEYVRRRRLRGARS